MSKPITVEILNDPTILIAEWLSEVNNEVAVDTNRVATKDRRALILKGIAEQIESAREKLPK